MIIPEILLASKRSNGYTEEAAKRKEQFHAEGKRFLVTLAVMLGLKPDEYHVRNNLGGAAVQGEVILHADSLYFQLYPALDKRCVNLLYRSCKGRKDFEGGTTHKIEVAKLADDEVLQRFLRECKRIGGLA